MARKPMDTKRGGRPVQEGNDGTTYYRKDYDPDRVPRRSSATTYLSDGKGGPIMAEDVVDRPEVFKLSSEALMESDGRRGGNQRVWDWALMERIYVEGIIGDDGDRWWPSLVDIQRWSGITEGVIRNRCARDNWTDKKRIHEERIPALVEEAASRVVGEKMGSYLAAADEAVARKGAVEWLQEIAGEYLPNVLKRLKGENVTCPECGTFLRNVPLVNHNVQDAERLIKLMFQAEGMSQQRLVIVSAVQWNINAQRDATVKALQEAMARNIIEEHQVTAILDIIGNHVGAVRWRYRVDPSEMMGQIVEVVANEP
jgi:hypothetical protein